jgi:CheY-like chemotaxis protein
VLLEVADTGVGMGEETRAHLFEPFYTTKEVGRGTGLGLATVYGIVRQSQGQIEVESAPGRGTTFRIWLPATLETAATPTRASVPAAILGEGETILIVEDSDVVRRLAREILQAHGYKVLDAPNGARGLIQAETHRGPIHLLLTDVVMPGISGIECAKRLLQGRPGTRVLYMSGYAEEAVLRQGVLASKTPYLQKPFTPTALALKVAEVLRKISAPPRSDLERFC